MIIDTQETLSEVPMQIAIDALTVAGNRIAERLAQANKQKWSKLLEAWRHAIKGTVRFAVSLHHRARQKNR